MNKLFTLLSSALLATGAWAQNTHEGHEYVNLGLPSGTMWATCNIGADAPEAAGYYYAWGETGTKENYDWSTYKWCKGSDRTLTKYLPKSKASGYGYEGFYDDKVTLDKVDDVASQTWGGSWVVPTHAQQDELCNECDWEWTSINGVNGYKVKSRVNSNFIFLPAAGSRWSTKFYDVGDNGNYWSSSLNESFPNNAQYLDISLSKVSSLIGSSRGSGYSIRPVCVPPAPIAQITIGETTTKYYDAVALINAVFASQETASVKLLADINLGNGSLTISKKDTEVVLDLNGHSLNGAVTTSNNNAHLIICDNSEEQTGSIVSSNIPVIAFASTSITINGGTFVGKTAIYLDDESSVTLNAGKFDVVEKTLDYASENATITLGESKALKLADNTILTKITGNVEQSSEVIDAPSTPTAIESIDADTASKVVKTIENGKVVIIRGDKKYDLSGREL